jgi:3-phosphoshikimate 1-carboxyvinyltransferase
LELRLKGKKLSGELRTPSDKSISHRAVMLSRINEGRVVIRNFLRADDCLRTLKAMVELGVKVEDKGKELVVFGSGKVLKEPFNVLDLGNSGTSMRLLSGILAGQNFYSVLTGDEYLRRRPMDRIIVPLREMGAILYGRDKNRFPPLTIIGKEKLSGISYRSPVPSAQVKSAILLAGLYSEEKVEVEEPFKSRDHTERMLREFGVEVLEENLRVCLGKKRELKYEGVIEIPADISSSAFFICGAVITPGSSVVLKEVILNPTRTGILRVLKRMGAKVEVINKKTVCGEEAGDIVAEYSPELKSTVISGEEIPTLIDEIPILALTATQAEGRTVIKDAKELRVKESDRIKSTVENLRILGAKVEELEDGMIIEGPCRLKGGKGKSFGDHRIAMMLAIASLISEEEVVIDETSCIGTSYPDFFEDLKKVLY